MEASAYAEKPEVLAYRVREQGRLLDSFNEWRREVDSERATRKEQMVTLETNMANLTTAVDGLRKALVGFALTIAGAAVVFALSILAATGKL